MTDRSRRKLLWPASHELGLYDAPSWLVEAIESRFHQVEVVVAWDEETLLREIEDCEILVAWRIRPEQFARARALRWIHSTAAGVTALLVPALIASDVVVTNATTVHAAPVAEQAIALVLALARRLRDSFENQAARRWGQADGWKPAHLPTEVNGKTLGLVGLGAIGREVAARARGLGMNVAAVRRDPSRGTEGADRVYPVEQLPRLLEEADFLVLAAPGTPATHHLIGEAELRRMKRSACLVNVSRGSLVDTEALVRALESGTIAGAALDVTDPEPLPPEHPLWTLPNVLITPHLASATERLWQRQGDLLLENLRRYFASEPLLNLVDKKRGY